MDDRHAGGAWGETMDEMDSGTARHPADVVVIDDEYGARLQVELAIETSPRLRLAGQAANGMRGAELVEELQPDIVVLDLSMPVMDGYEALPLIRRLCPTARVLVRSSCDEEDAWPRARDLGAAEFIPKFLDPYALCSRIEAYSEPPLPASLAELARRLARAERSGDEVRSGQASH